MANVKPESKVFIESMDILVPVRLNKLESEGSGKVDQTVPVTRNGETLIIQRGEHVEIPKWAFMQLYESGRFPEL